jgi:large repetitive protein
LDRLNKKRATATALLVIVLCVWIAPLRASAQLLPPLPGGSLIVTITSPAFGCIVNGTVPVDAYVSVVGSITVAGVQFKRDGVNIGTLDTTTPYSVSWNTTTATNGSHTLTAVARDLLGAPWTSNPVTVTVANDTTRPTVTINQAAGQVDPTTAAPIRFTAIFSEAVSGFTGTDVTISGTAGGIKTVVASGGPSTYYVAVSGMTTAGSVIATIADGVAQDGAGNMNAASTSIDNRVVFGATPAPPSTPDLAPASDAGVSDSDNLTNVNNPTFTGTAETGSTVKLFSDGVQIGSGTATGGVYGITTTQLSDGTRNITATATDAANNVSSPSGALSVTINTTPPTVVITSPSNGATISGTEPVTASASDDVPIAGVLFMLDGLPPGADDTTAPYEVPFNTTHTSNGSHSLTATARDAAGNQTTSAPVTVTVSNVTRIEENSPAVGATGVWVFRGADVAAFSGGAAGSSDVTGSTATLGFTGTAVSWIGLKCNICGIATVSIDGGTATSVDTASAAAPGSPGLTSESVFTASGLAAGNHTMVITVTGTTTSGGAHIVVDAFDVTP